MKFVDCVDVATIEEQALASFTSKKTPKPPQPHHLFPLFASISPKAFHSYRNFGLELYWVKLPYQLGCVNLYRPDCGDQKSK
jgi:hypothetical protein